MRVDQFWLPAMICAVPDTTGLAALTPLMLLIAVASAAVRGLVEPAPAATPPRELLPRMTLRALVASPDNCETTTALAPSPRATIPITAATPMVMPNILRRPPPLF